MVTPALLPQEHLFNNGEREWHYTKMELPDHVQVSSLSVIRKWDQSFALRGLATWQEEQQEWVLRIKGSSLELKSV